MKLGAAIFLHSIGMVLRNYIAVLRIFGGPTVIIGAAMFALFRFLNTTDPSSAGGGSVALFVAAILGIIVVAWSGVMWVVVAWHRYILLEEYPEGFLPELHKSQMWAYFLNSLKIALIVAGLSIPLGLLFVGTAQAIEFSILALVGVAVYLAISVLVLRFSLILPAAAIGEEISVGESLDHTEGRSFSLLVLVICLIGLQFSGDYLISLLAGAQIIQEVLATVFSIFIVVLQISVLTTLYGHFVQGRPVT